MSSGDEIVDKLREVSALLAANGQTRWSVGFEQLAAELPSNPEAIKAKIRGCYGGMGSFNDLVLHRERLPLKDENIELDRLREELWNLCRG